MASLIEQRNAYMTRLQTLIKESQADIDAKVQAYRAQLEQSKVTDEMRTLVAFIENLDEMIKYDNTGVVPAIDEVKDEVEDEIGEPVVEEAVANAAAEPATFKLEIESKDSAPVVEGPKQDDAGNETAVKTVAEELAGTGFEAIATDLADTRAKLKAANSSRDGMSDVVLPRR